MAVLKRVHDEVRAPLLAARSVAYIDELGELGGSDDPDVKTVACQRIHVFFWCSWFLLLGEFPKRKPFLSWHVWVDFLGFRRSWSWFSEWRRDDWSQRSLKRGKEILVRSTAVGGAVRSLSGPIPTTAPPGRQLLCSSRSSGSSSSCCCGMRCGVINFIGDNMDVNYNNIGDKLLIYNNIIIKGCGLWVQGSPIHLS